LFFVIPEFGFYLGFGAYLRFCYLCLVLGVLFTFWLCGLSFFCFFFYVVLGLFVVVFIFLIFFGFFWCLILESAVCFGLFL